MCKGALACRASPSHALALCTAFKGSCPLASSAAIADASVQPACMQLIEPSTMVSSGVCRRRVAAMLLGQRCCCDALFLDCKRSMGAQFTDASTCVWVCMCWTTDRLFFDSQHSKPWWHICRGTQTDRQTDIQTDRYMLVFVICAPTMLS